MSAGCDICEGSHVFPPVCSDLLFTCGKWALRSAGQGFDKIYCWAQRVYDFCEWFSPSWVNVRSSWRGSRLNVHTISMKHRLSQLPASVICKKTCFMRPFLQYTNIKHRACFCTTGVRRASLWFQFNMLFLYAQTIVQGFSFPKSRKSGGLCNILQAICNELQTEQNILHGTFAGDIT